MYLYRFYRRQGNNRGDEICFYVETSQPLSLRGDLDVLEWLLAETFEPGNFSNFSFLAGKKVYEVGPRLNFATAYSTNAVAICHACGLTNITRVERSRRSLKPLDFDRMTEMVYPEPLESFELNILPEPVFVVPVLEEGPDALRRISKQMGLGMDEEDIKLYYHLFVEVMKRNPTNVE